MELKPKRLLVFPLGYRIIPGFLNGGANGFRPSRVGNPLAGGPLAYLELDYCGTTSVFPGMCPVVKSIPLKTNRKTKAQS